MRWFRWFPYDKKRKEKRNDRYFGGQIGNANGKRNGGSRRGREGVWKAAAAERKTGRRWKEKEERERHTRAGSG